LPTPIKVYLVKKFSIKNSDKILSFKIWKSRS
jgi:hypothetical protein